MVTSGTHFYQVNIRIKQLQSLTQIHMQCNKAINYGWTSRSILTDCTRTPESMTPLTFATPNNGGEKRHHAWGLQL